MASYKVTSKVTAGLYDSQNSDHQALQSDRSDTTTSGSSPDAMTSASLFTSRPRSTSSRGTGLAFDADLEPDIFNRVQI